MKKLSKYDLQRRDDIIERFTAFKTKEADLFSAIQAAVSEYNALEEDLNDIVSDANGWLEDMVSQMDEYMSERSEKWQDSEAGEAYSSWKDAFEGCAIEHDPITIEISEPELPDFDQLIELPESPEEV